MNDFDDESGIDETCGFIGTTRIVGIGGIAHKAHLATSRATEGQCELCLGERFSTTIERRRDVRKRDRDVLIPDKLGQDHDGTLFGDLPLATVVSVFNLHGPVRL